MRPKSIADQYSRSLVSSVLGLRIEYTYQPLQADIRVGVSCLSTRILPSRSRERGPVASMSSSRPNDKRIQIPTISTDTFDRVGSQDRCFMYVSCHVPASINTRRVASFLQSSLLHQQIAVTVVRLTRAPLCFRKSLLRINTLTDPGIDSMTPVSSIL